VEAHAHANEYEIEPTATVALSWWDRFTTAFNRSFNRLLDFYELWVRRAVKRPALTVAALSGAFLVSVTLYTLLGLAFFPHTDAGQVNINLNVPIGSLL